MSLVGSLEDLGLGDILQIIHLSRKSGVLWIRSQQGEGQIVFGEGLIRAAFTQDGVSDLASLLGAGDSVPKRELEEAVERARAQGVPLASVLVERSLLTSEALEDVIGEHLSAAVVAMFRWSTGEFSFEIQEREDDGDEELILRPGLNPQFLALEGTRIQDEAGAAREEDDASPEGASASSEHEAEDVVFVAASDEAELEGEILDGSDLEILDGEELADAEVAEPPGPEAAAQAEPEPSEPEVAAAVAERAPSPASVAAVTNVPTVVIDADLAALEWVKRALAETHPRVHIFQRSEQGISRIRQYLARAGAPVVLLAADAPADSLSGARDAEEILRRLKGQAPRMPVFLLRRADEVGEDEPGGDADGILAKPTPSQLADPRCAGDLDRLALRLRDDLVAWSSAGPPSASAASSGGLSAQTLAHLRELSARLRDPGSQGDVLSLVLRFAAETFARVAMFMVRDDEALGMAQVGLPRAGGPDDVGLREVRLPTREAAWFRRVLEEGGAVRAAPGDEGDQRLAVLLGNAIPAEAYVAPIESGERIVALLYGDNLPSGDPIGDTTALEVVLHEAGLALDRAVLERALAEAESA